MQLSTLLTLYVADDGEWLAAGQKGDYAASPGGERLMGWHVSNGVNAMASHYPASQLRKALDRPDVIRRLGETRSLKEAKAIEEGGRS